MVTKCNDSDKTKDQLINELAQLRQQNEAMAMELAASKLQQEINERKRVEAALRKAEQEKTLILSSMSERVLFYDLNMRIIWANRAAEELAGLTSEQMVGRSCYEVWQKSDRPCAGCPILTVLITGKEQEGEMSTPDGRVWFMRVYPVRDESGNMVGIVEVSMDITERKLAQEELRVSEANYRAIFDAANDGIQVIDIETGDMLDTNKKITEMFGYSPEESRTLKIRDLSFGGSPYAQEDALKHIRKAFRGEPQLFEWMAKDKSGRLFWVEVNLKKAIIGDKERLLAIVRDITERKQMEREMAKFERLNLIGEMAAGIAHEVRNPMTTVRGFLQMFGESKKLKQYKEQFNLMIEELDRANSIISEFLSLAKNKPINLKLYNLNAIVKTLAPLIVADAIVTDKCLKVEPGDIPDIYLDEKEIRQLILNLVRNGLEAMSPGGTLLIRTYKDEEAVVLSVQDQGKGIEPEVLEKIGTPFFTTKDNGTGLGLAVCYSIAARHNATIRAKTSTEGTTFLVRFKL